MGMLTLKVLKGEVLMVRVELHWKTKQDVAVLVEGLNQRKGFLSIVLPIGGISMNIKGIGKVKKV
eukprot:4227870-Ditylum_brightwellii.AAC.1